MKGELMKTYIAYFDETEAGYVIDIDILKVYKPVYR